MAGSLSGADIHLSLSDPTLSSMNFLNEIANQYPDSISFAPGRPHESFLADIDPAKLLATFENHLRAKGQSEQMVRRTILQYGAAAGIINDLVADAVTREQGFPVDPRQVVVTVGAQEAIFIVLRTLCGGRGDVAMVTDPCYIGMSGAAKLLDIELLPARCRPDGLDLEELDRVARAAPGAGKNVRVLYLVPDFANPDGYTITRSDRLLLIDMARRHDFLLIEDNPYGFTAAPGRRVPSLKSLDSRTHPRVIQVGTFAKTGVPGARVGYVVADQQVERDSGDTCLAAEISTVKSMITLNTSPICQAIIGGMLLELAAAGKSPGQDRAGFYRENLSRLATGLDRAISASETLRGQVRWNKPEGGFFLLVRLTFPVEESLLERSAREYGVLWTPMTHFYLRDADQGKFELRLSYSYLSPQEIDDGVGRLVKFLEDVAERHRSALESETR